MTMINTTTIAAVMSAMAPVLLHLPKLGHTTRTAIVSLTP